ncbi:amino acid permease [Fulvivirga sp. M361]|uniref:amino acid permease n=1 Tax=Fulvivirga sp. M361 TaxID=2594266 RepID=UPI001179A670|nr:amino acid permease [Fulvivirga sp. M361]TRX60540.1 amino acid permease [Fulvivirga sp. M361]
MAKQNKFGTFGGVFVPSILTILGVIMYLRLPMIVGEAGLWATIGIIIVAHIISATTGLSVSSIATDKKVEAGGTYFMISRSLGLPIGGTLGLALFVGLSFSVSLYLIGFSESFLSYWGFSTDINNIRLTGSIVLLAVTTLTFISTSFAIKTQYFIMAAIGLSLLSILFGNHELTPAVPHFINSESSVSLMVLFGIFFPAVTGFEAGVSMSGDLKDPKRSIPGGSIMAIVVGLAVYIGLSFFLAYTVNSESLAGDPKVLLNIAWVPELVIAGIWGATLSSALGSILGAPRILQATASDRITPKFFAKGYGATNEPRNALLLTFVIAEAGILIGELDVIARVVSIFFITTYGFLNISAAFEKWTSADFRPEFKVSGWISLLGAAACILVMIQLDFIAMLGAIIILGLLFLYLKRKELTLDSGDAWSGVWASLVKTGLTNLKKDKLHKRNWRPNTIMFSGDANTRTYMVELGKGISGKLGILSAFELVESNNRILAKTSSDLSQEKDTAGYFTHKLYCRDVYSGMDEIARVYGFSGIEPNTILMGWSRNRKNKEQFITLLDSFKHYNYNSLFLNYNKEKAFGNYKTIDIWWSGSGRNLALALNLVRHISTSPRWELAKIRLLIINPKNEEAENVYKATAGILSNYRDDAEIRLVNNEIDPLTDKEIITEESKDTDLVIMGLPEENYHLLDKHFDQITHINDSIGSTLVINASSDFESYEVITQAKGKTLSALEEEQASLELPLLAPSRYEEIATDIVKIDTNGQKAIELFYRKTFRPFIHNHLNTLSAFKEKIALIRKEKEKIATIPDAYRKRKAIDKLKNDILFKVNSLLTEKLKDNELPALLVQLTDGINWYQNKLREDFKRYPQKLKIKYHKKDFEVFSKDRFALKVLKRYKKIKHWFVGQPMTHKVAYREVARYYQLNNRQVLLHQFLTRFEEEEIVFYNVLRKITNAMNSYLNEEERSIWTGENGRNDKLKLSEISAIIEKEYDHQKNLAQLREGRLKLEFRKNARLMSNDLETLDINHNIRKKTRPAKYYRKQSSQIADFGEEYERKVKTLLNMILMELSVNATRNRIEALHDEFNSKLRQTVSQKYLKDLEATAKKIKKADVTLALSKFKIDENLEAELQEAYNESHERMLNLVEGMPESLEVYSVKADSKDDNDTVSIPVARMAEYYLKSRYEVAVEEEFEKVLDILKRSVYTFKDLLNLTQFNLENSPAETDNITKKEVLADCALKLEQEKSSILAKIDQFVSYSDEQFENVFEPLSSLKIEESAGDFTSDLRNYQGQQVLTGLNQVTDKVAKFTRSIVSKVLYGRSEGILFTKKFNKPKELNSSNSKLLDIREKVNPSEEVIEALPPYYVALFNGRSNISNDFWIPRSEEEQAFNKAIKRYQQGFHGGILILGERNSGKTAFGKYVVQRYLKGHTSYAVFPPTQGTVTLEGFNTALRKATLKSGDTDQIMGHLPQGTVLVINDLELFWERTGEGMEVVRLIERLIDDYGEKVLFIVNLNPHAFKLINQLTGFGVKFIENINFAPFNAEELRDLIMKRHRSSGLAIGLNAVDDSLNEVQMAQLFNGYFTYSEGVPGTALNGWLSHIKKSTAQGLILQKPDYPSISGLKELHEDWIMLLMQFVLHKRLNAEKIERITNWSSATVKALLLAMLRAGIIIDKVSGVYHLDPFIHPFVVKALKEKDVLS